MALLLQIGPLTARRAQNADDVSQCQRLRHLAFFGMDGLDSDEFDEYFDHILIENAGELVATFRSRMIVHSELITDTYTGKFYQISGLSGPLIELGRLCLTPCPQGADVLRIIWAVIAQQVDAAQAQWLIGCSSFEGTEPAAYRDCFARLGARYNVGKAIKITPRAFETIDLLRVNSGHDVAQKPMPSLLRSYLALGGKVGPSAVVDHQMGTIHLCTVVEIAAIPAARAAALRALAAT